MGSFSCNGQSQFRSDQSATYYYCLLRSDEPMPEILKTLDCSARMEAISDRPIAHASLSALPCAPQRLVAAIVDRPPPPLPLMDADDEVDGGSNPDPVLVVSGLDPDPDPVDDDPVDGADVEEEGVPFSILGVRVSVEQHTARDRGLRITCPYHDNCKSFRSLRQDVDVFGPRSAEFFLCTWLSRADMGDQHSGFRPSRRDIRAYLAERD